MAKQGYYIITDEQATVLDFFQIPYVNLGGKNCVSDWDSVYRAILDAIEADDNWDPQEEQFWAYMEERTEYMYWSTEAHSWSPAL